MHVGFNVKEQSRIQVNVLETRFHYQFSIAVITGLKMRNIAKSLSPGHGLMVSPTVLVPFASSLWHRK